MQPRFREYEAVLRRIPHVERAEIVETEPGRAEVHVVSYSDDSPRHVLREIVAVLKSYGWTDLKPENVVLVKMQNPQTRPSAGRLQIVGYTVGYGAPGYIADCRLAHGDRQYQGHGESASVLHAVATATLDAVNTALGTPSLLTLLESQEVSAAGRQLALVVVGGPDGDIMAGNAVMYDTWEETVIRAVLDAINRRFLLYSGQKV